MATKSKKTVAKSAKGRTPVKSRAPAKVEKKSEFKFRALHDKLIKLFSRPTGATLSEIKAAGYDYAPGIFALRIAERRGYKIAVVKKAGERARYIAKGTAKKAA